jgi:hypothetical protein
MVAVAVIPQIQAENSIAVLIKVFAARQHICGMGAALPAVEQYGKAFGVG